MNKDTARLMNKDCNSSCIETATAHIHKLDCAHFAVSIVVVATESSHVAVSVPYGYIEKGFGTHSF